MINLSDFTFTIPLKIESADRMENAITFFEYMTAICQTNYIVYENDSECKIKELIEKYGFNYRLINEKTFHRTKFLNQMALESSTPFVVNCDIDCLVSEEQYKTMAEILRNNSLDGCVLFDQCTRNTNKDIHKRIREYKNVSIIQKSDYNISNPYFVACGGIIAWNKIKFIEMGMENENFMAWGPEDWERVHRASKLGLRIGRIKGALYHIDHSRTEISNDDNPYLKQNHAEFEKIKKMSPQQLLSYIKTWSWYKN